MFDCFDELREISQKEFLNNYRHHEETKGWPDQFAKYVYKQIETDQQAKYYKGLLNGKGYEKLIMPWHDHGIGLVPPGGWPIKEALTAYKTQLTKTNAECIEKISSLQSIFKIGEDPLYADFLFFSNKGDLVHPGHYTHQGERLYLGNGFHRILAYAIWNESAGFKRLKVYYVHAP